MPEARETPLDRLWEGIVGSFLLSMSDMILERVLRRLDIDESSFEWFGSDWILARMVDLKSLVEEIVCFWR